MIVISENINGVYMMMIINVRLTRQVYSQKQKYDLVLLHNFASVQCFYEINSYYE